MQFPNALEGVKKIYKAEIIALISAVVMVIAALIMIVGAAAESAGGVLGGGVLFIAVAVLGIIAFIMNLVGLNKAKLDDDNFKTALYITIIGIVASILLGATKEGTLLNSLGSNVDKICEFLVTWFVCTGIISLSDKLGDEAMRQRGVNARKLLLIGWCVNIVISILGDVFEASESGAVGIIALVLMLASAVIEIIVYILYLKLLSKARTMLEK